MSVSPEDTEWNNDLEVDRPEQNGNKSNKIKSFVSFRGRFLAIIKSFVVCIVKRHPPPCSPYYKTTCLSSGSSYISYFGNATQ